MQRITASIARCCMGASEPLSETTVTMRRYGEDCLTVNVSRVTARSAERVGHEDAREQLRADELVHLHGVVEVPLPRGADQRQEHPGDVVRGLLEVEPGPHPALALLTLEERDEIAGDEAEGPVSLGREQREQPLGLGDEDLLQDLVLDDGPVREHEPLLDQRREVGRTGDRLGERSEEPAHLPRDDLAHELVLAAGEGAVDRGARDGRLLHDVVDRRLAHAEARDARVRGLEQPLAQRGIGARQRRAQKPSNVSRPTVRPGRLRTARIASSTPGMNDDRSYESWRIVSDCPAVPSSTSWCATSPRSRTECTWIAPSTSAPRAPGTTTSRVGSVPQSFDAAAMRSAVRIDVPDGASAFASWCSSMISALSKYGAASSAKRIMRTAPIAKFGATSAFAPESRKRPSSSARSSWLKPVVPITAWTPLAAHHAAFSFAAATTVKSTATSVPACVSASAFGATCTPVPGMPSWARSIPAWCGSTAATSSSSGSSRTARHTVEPMRPPAPNTPTRTMRRDYRPPVRVAGSPLLRRGRTRRTGPRRPACAARPRGPGRRRGRRRRVSPRRRPRRARRASGPTRARAGCVRAGACGSPSSPTTAPSSP